ncbi:MAG: hypothetical protein QOG92_1691 [Verrucomicrobiota bacterium]|nr:hypothetical protein [Verrucomicrobiota bacterium]
MEGTTVKREELQELQELQNKTTEVSLPEIEIKARMQPLSKKLAISGQAKIELLQLLQLLQLLPLAPPNSCLD